MISKTLNLLFIVMDLLILLAYPIVFVYDKLHMASESKESNPLANVLVQSHPLNNHRKRLKMRKKGNYAYAKD